MKQSDKSYASWLKNDVTTFQITRYVWRRNKQQTTYLENSMFWFLVPSIVNSRKKSQKYLEKNPDITLCMRNIIYPCSTQVPHRTAEFHINKCWIENQNLLWKCFWLIFKNQYFLFLLYVIDVCSFKTMC